MTEEYDVDLDQNPETMKRLIDQLDAAAAPRKSIEASLANHYVNTSCGILHLGWAVDAFWTKVSNEIFIPGLLSIHEALVKKNNSEKKTMSWGDADGELYYITCKDRKVIVFTTQTRNYLFILSPITQWNSVDHSETETHTLHIRRVWDLYEEKKDSWEAAEVRKALKSPLDAIDYVESLEKFADDHAQYPQRPSIEMYRKIKFNLDNFSDKPRFYGDCRDPGYIISLENRFENSRAEYTMTSYHELQMLATCNLGVMARDCEVKIKELNGYGMRRGEEE